MLHFEYTVCATSRLDVMSLPVDCVFQAKYRVKCSRSMWNHAKTREFNVTRSEVRQSTGNDITSTLEVVQTVVVVMQD